MPHKTYRSPADFQKALESRLQDMAKKEAIHLQGVRREVAFDRLLVRLFRCELPDKMPWVLKGGYAMELRIQSAHATKDIDLTVRVAGSADASTDSVLQRLRDSAGFNAGDFLYLRSENQPPTSTQLPMGVSRFPIARLHLAPCQCEQPGT
jgi:hypothetical protein